jgi:hypothetical protein
MGAPKLEKILIKLFSTGKKSVQWYNEAGAYLSDLEGIDYAGKACQGEILTYYVNS